MSTIAPEALDHLETAVEVAMVAQNAGRDRLASEQRKLEAAVKLAMDAQKRYLVGRGYLWRAEAEAKVMAEYVDGQMAVKSRYASRDVPADRTMRFPVGPEEPRRDSVGPVAPRPTEPITRSSKGPLFTLANGTKVRGVLHDESFADSPGDGADLGRALVGAITGIGSGQTRAQTLTPDPSGGYFVSPQMSSILIDQARASSILVAAGAITLPLAGPETRIVKVTGDPTAGWHDELSPLTNTSVTLGSITLAPRTLGAVIDVSQELMEDAANAGEVLTRVLAEAVAVQLDRSLFRGVEADRPFSGVLDDPDMNTVDMGTNGLPITDFTPYLDAIEKVETANGPATVRIEHPRTSRVVAGLTDTTNQPLRAPDAVANLRHLKTTQVPIDMEHGTATDASAVIVGDFTSAFVILGVRSAFRIEVSRQAGDAFENHGVKIKITGRYDLAVGRPSHLARIEGIIP